MRQLTSSRGVALLFAGLAAASVTACVSPGSQSIVGPDGSPMAHVHCGSEQGACFRIAGELCPHGYELQPVLQSSDGNFLVRCHDAQVAASVTSTRPLPVAPSAPSPLMYPWPPPETAAAAPRPSAPTSPSGAPAEIDLGY